MENEQMYILHRYAGSAHLHAWSVTNIFLKAKANIFTKIQAILPFYKAVPRGGALMCKSMQKQTDVPLT